jgi:hypothetical protein
MSEQKPPPSVFQQDPPPDPTTRPTGPGGGTIVEGRIYDLAPSVHDPRTDLTFPVVPYARWADYQHSALLHADIVERSLRSAERTHGGNRAGETSRQRALPKERLAALIAQGDKDPAFARTVRRSQLVFGEVMNAFQNPLPGRVDLRCSWYGARDQKNSGGCVGWAVADAIWRQNARPMDVPSARFLWLAAKELDGDRRPTTPIASAGTSVRAALTVATRYGVALEAELPSNTNDLYTGSSTETFFKTIGTRKIKGFVNLGNDVKIRLAWLAMGRPVISVLRCGPNFLEARGDTVAPERDDADDFMHAVVLSGFEIGGGGEPHDLATTVATLGERKDITHDEFPVRYLVRNSAGVNWGDQGYGWIHHVDYFRRFVEDYGIYTEEDDRAFRTMEKKTKQDNDEVTTVYQSIPEKGPAVTPIADPNVSTPHQRATSTDPSV